MGATSFANVTADWAAAGAATASNSGSRRSVFDIRPSELKSGGSCAQSPAGARRICGSPLHDGNLRLEDPALAAFRALARLGQLVLIEHEPARTAARRQDDDVVSGGTSRPDHVPERVFNVGPRQAQL